MKRLSLLTLLFALISVVFFLLLIFFRVPFNLYPLMSWQDAIDLLTPLVLIPFYWVLFKVSSTNGPKPVSEIWFMVLASLWVLGQGMHLAANSVNNLSEALAKQGLNILETDIYTLTYFLDEHLSHFIWHIGYLGLAGLLVWHEWRSPAGYSTTWWAAITGGVIYGFNTFCIILEGQTVPLGLPFTVIFSIFALAIGMKKFTFRPLLAFFFISFSLAALLFIGWWLYFGGFPQFSEVGLI